MGEDGGANLGVIRRRGLFNLASAAREDETGSAALHLFWQSLAWGTGNSHQNIPGRIASVAADQQRAGEIPHEAACLASTSPEAAFLKL